MNIPHSFETFNAMLLLDGNMIIECKLCNEPFTKRNVHTRGGWHWTQTTGICEECFDREQIRRLRMEGYSVED
jgi:hypothetical protein